MLSYPKTEIAVSSFSFHWKELFQCGFLCEHSRMLCDSHNNTMCALAFNCVRRILSQRWHSLIFVIVIMLKLFAHSSRFNRAIINIYERANSNVKPEKHLEYLLFSDQSKTTTQTRSMATKKMTTEEEEHKKQ